MSQPHDSILVEGWELAYKFHGFQKGQTDGQNIL